MMLRGTIFQDGVSNNSYFNANHPVNKMVVHKYKNYGLGLFMRDRFLESGVLLNTADLNVGADVELEVYIEIPSIRFLDEKVSKVRVLFSFENPVLESYSYTEDDLGLFDKIYSWNSEGFGFHRGFVEIMIPYETHQIKKWAGERKGFLCLINANKSYKKNVYGDLYKERFKLIRWLEKYHSEHFDLYGMGWNKPYQGSGNVGKLTRNAVSFFSKAVPNYKIFPSWKGEPDTKSEVYEKYTFAVCYENISTQNNYITEKIFDAMISGCIPIYWGAPNIKDYIPGDCFIDRREFSSNEQLYRFLRSLKSSQIQAYREGIYDWLVSCDFNKFSYERNIGNAIDDAVSLLSERY